MSGILTTDTKLDDSTRDELKKAWEERDPEVFCKDCEHIRYVLCPDGPYLGTEPLCTHPSCYEGLETKHPVTGYGAKKERIADWGDLNARYDCIHFELQTDPKPDPEPPPTPEPTLLRRISEYLLGK